MQREQKVVRDPELYWVDTKPTGLLAVVEVAGFLGAWKTVKYSNNLINTAVLSIVSKFDESNGSEGKANKQKEIISSAPFPTFSQYLKLKNQRGFMESSIKSGKNWETSPSLGSQELGVGLARGEFNPFHSPEPLLKSE